MTLNTFCRFSLKGNWFSVTYRAIRLLCLDTYFTDKMISIFLLKVTELCGLKKLLS